MDYAGTDRIETADLVILNTCSVRDRAEQKVYSALGRWKELKEQREGVIIGVGGCVAQQEGANLLKRLPHLDLVFGTHNIHKLPQMVEQVEVSRSRPVETAFYRDSVLHGRSAKPNRSAGALKLSLRSCRDAIKSVASASCPTFAGAK